MDKLNTTSIVRVLREIVATVLRELVGKFGNGFEEKVSTPSRQLAEYLTVLPPKKQLEAKLHEALQLAKERYHVED